MKISFLGDISLNGILCSDSRNNSDRFKKVSAILKQSDLVFANLEAPLWGGGEINERKNNLELIHFSYKHVFNDVLPLLNVTGLSLANNHIYDCKLAGIKNTLQSLEQLGIKYTGAGCRKQHIEPVFFEKKHQKIGFIAYVDQVTNPLFGQNSNIYVNLFDERHIISDIIQTKKKCDFLILSIHWGIDYSYYPTGYQRIICRTFIDSGVDIIMGHHTHTAQPYEFYKNSIIFYSLGSFIHGDWYKGKRIKSLPLKTKESFIAIYNLDYRKLKIIPIKIQKQNYIFIGKNSFHKKLSIRRFIMKMKHKNNIVNILIDIKESFADEIIDYFFGYYKDPLNQFLNLFQMIQIKKINILIKNYIWKQNRIT